MGLILNWPPRAWPSPACTWRRAASPSAEPKPAFIRCPAPAAGISSAIPKSFCSIPPAGNACSHRATASGSFLAELLLRFFAGSPRRFAARRARQSPVGEMRKARTASNSRNATASEARFSGLRVRMTILYSNESRSSESRSS